MREVVVFSAVRTPVGRYCGVLRGIPVYRQCRNSCGRRDGKHESCRVLYSRLIHKMGFR